MVLSNRFGREPTETRERTSLKVSLRASLFKATRPGEDLEHRRGQNDRESMVIPGNPGDRQLEIVRTQIEEPNILLPSALRNTQNRDVQFSLVATPGKGNITRYTYIQRGHLLGTDGVVERPTYAYLDTKLDEGGHVIVSEVCETAVSSSAFLHSDISETGVDVIVPAGSEVFVGRLIPYGDESSHKPMESSDQQRIRRVLTALDTRHQTQQ